MRWKTFFFRPLPPSTAASNTEGAALDPRTSASAQQLRLSPSRSHRRKRKGCFPRYFVHARREHRLAPNTTTAPDDPHQPPVVTHSARNLDAGGNGRTQLPIPAEQRHDAPQNRKRCDPSWPSSPSRAQAADTPRLSPNSSAQGDIETARLQQVLRCSAPAFPLPRSEREGGALKQPENLSVVHRQCVSSHISFRADATSSHRTTENSASTLSPEHLTRSVSSRSTENVSPSRSPRLGDVLYNKRLPPPPLTPLSINATSTIFSSRLKQQVKVEHPFQPFEPCSAPDVMRRDSQSAGFLKPSGTRSANHANATKPSTFNLTKVSPLSSLSTCASLPYDVQVSSDFIPSVRLAGASASTFPSNPSVATSSVKAADPEWWQQLLDDSSLLRTVHQAPQQGPGSASASAATSALLTPSASYASNPQEPPKTTSVRSGAPMDTPSSSLERTHSSVTPSAEFQNMSCHPRAATASFQTINNASNQNCSRKHIFNASLPTSIALPRAQTSHSPCSSSTSTQSLSSSDVPPLPSLQPAARPQRLGWRSETALRPNAPHQPHLIPTGPPQRDPLLAPPNVHGQLSGNVPLSRYNFKDAHSCLLDDMSYTSTVRLPNLSVDLEDRHTHLSLDRDPSTLEPFSFNLFPIEKIKAAFQQSISTVQQLSSAWVKRWTAPSDQVPGQPGLCCPNVSGTPDLRIIHEEISDFVIPPQPFKAREHIKESVALRHRRPFESRPLPTNRWFKPPPLSRRFKRNRPFIPPLRLPPPPIFTPRPQGGGSTVPSVASDGFSGCSDSERTCE